MNNKPELIVIEVSGRVAKGKSAILATIRDMLKEHGYCVVNPDRAERLNPSDNLDNCDHHEKPPFDTTVIALIEKVVT